MKEKHHYNNPSTRHKREVPTIWKLITYFHSKNRTCKPKIEIMFHFLDTNNCQRDDMFCLDVNKCPRCHWVTCHWPWHQRYVKLRQDDAHIINDIKIIKCSMYAIKSRNASRKYTIFYFTPYYTITPPNHGRLSTVLFAHFWRYINGLVISWISPLMTSKVPYTLVCVLLITEKF